VCHFAVRAHALNRTGGNETHYFIVTLASAIAAGMFGGGNGPASTSTKAAFPEIGASQRSFAGGVQFPPVSFVCSFSSPLRGLTLGHR